MQHSASTLVLFFKRPRHGFGKQRLAASIGAEKAFLIAKCLLGCAVEDLKAWSGNRVFAVESPDDETWANDLLAEHFPLGDYEIIVQADGNLGDRLNAADQKLRGLMRGAGAENILFIGSDAPILDVGFYECALNKLSTDDIVLASSSDGGVTLMGGQKPWPDLTDLPWSTNDLGHCLASACEDNGLSVATIDGYYDVDTLADLTRCVADLRADQRPMRQKLCAMFDQLELGR
jgi:glycosyltransferase A (GT-A) superfamily protein (DUF2064 family)